MLQKRKRPTVSREAQQVSKPDYTAPRIGRLPTRQDTVTAEVLRRLLEGECLTSIVGVHQANTTRLSAVTFTLRQDYGWICDTRDKAAGCKDARGVLGCNEGWLWEV